MTTFITDETGFDTSNPIELYRFVGSLDTYLYTSSNRVVDYNGESFRPIPVSRSEIILGDVTERNEVRVTVPITSKVCKDYGFDIPPPTLYLQVFRMHGAGGQVQPWFTGRVTSLVMEGVTCKMVIPSIFSAYMDSEFPNVLFQKQCNHTLYNERCAVSRAAFTLIGTINGISDETLIRVDAAADKPNGWAKAGEIVTSEERRLIVEHNGSQLTLNYPFRKMLVNMPVTIYAGCDHSIETCQAKFDNLANFLGFPYTPSLNPFLKGLI